VPSPVPKRLSWAVEQLHVDPSDRILEIGCGRGVAIELVCRALTTGRITAIDRSATATAAARARNAQCVRDGRAVVHTVALHEVSLPDDSLDKAFAVNVNLFWTGEAQDELDLIRRMLRAGGTLHLFYEPPSEGRGDSLVESLGPHLAAADYSFEIRRDGNLIHVAARPGSRSDGPTRV
jgi:cyclopropane fatty-acyl-phospholipid synthase-like methyltransferase